MRGNRSRIQREFFIVNICYSLKPLAVCLPLAVMALPVPAASAATQYQVLLNFDGLDGSIPIAPLTADKAGNLYGTTRDGGGTGCSFGVGCGTVFELTADGTETVLYSFTGGNDGAEPDGQLTRDKAGNLYGVTRNGGAAGYGVVFMVASDGTETVLHTFEGGANDGIYPQGGVLRDKKGRLFGVTQAGGAYQNGTVFELEPSGKLEILHSFAGGTDGSQPLARLVRDNNGNLYGTTIFGGPENVGTVFEIAPNGSKTLLYSFLGGTDGGEPSAPLVLDKSGNLYGTTIIGGADNNGVVFELSPSGAETVLYTFTGNADGGIPDSALSWDDKGNLYGTTQHGGNLVNCSRGCGVVFKLAPHGRETVLHAFEGGTDGDIPVASLIKDPATGGSTLYGTASGLGTQGSHGAIFKISK
jgi:uncharacterized repeat protein (TIGR03803 family)